MRFSALLFIYVAASQAFASVDADYALSLARARRPADIRRATENFERLKVARAACRLQLRARSAPLACYEALALENPRRRRELREKLDGLCAESAALLKVPRAEASESAVSPKCRKFLSEAREIRKYREKRPDWSGN
jgi:hypothetical protein